tara:strand:+ start:105251 stop:105541 length:291 start_codon:yes stop_codon:yes gene_type:complete
MMGRILVIVFSMCAFAIAPGVARAGLAQPTHEAPYPNETGERTTNRPSQVHAQDSKSYADRQEENPELEEFKGGDKVVISVGAGTLLVVILILILI